MQPCLIFVHLIEINNTSKSPIETSVLPSLEIQNKPTLFQKMDDMNHSKNAPNQNLFFRQLPLFQSLTLDQKEWLQDRIQFETLEGKSLIYKPNEPTNELYLIQKGKIKTEVINPDGKILIKRIGLPGDIIGEHLLYDVETRNEFAWSLQDPVEIYSIQISDLKKLMRENFDFLQNIFRIIGEQIQLAENRVHSFSVRQARWRVIDFLKEK